MRLAAEASGRLTGIQHIAVNNAGMVDTHVEPATLSSRNLYASDAIRTRQLIERVNLNVPTPMRAPLEGAGQWALESAMNELAEATGWIRSMCGWPISPRCRRPTVAPPGRATDCGRPTQKARADTDGEIVTNGRAPTGRG